MLSGFLLYFTMRKIFALFTTALILLSCKQEAQKEVIPLEITSKTTVEVTAEQQDRTYSGRCSEAITVDIPAGCTWAKVKTVKQGEDNNFSLTISYSLNDTEDKRTTVITIKAGGESKTINVSQKGLESIISSTSLTFEGLETKSLTIKTIKSDWTLELTDTKSAPSWITADVTSGKVNESVTVRFTTTDPNETMSDKNCFAKITMGSSYFYITLNQKKKDAIIADRDKIELTYSGGEFSITVGYNTKNLTYRIDGDWITRAQTKGYDELDKKTFDFNALENLDITDRIGYIIFTDGNIEETVTVYQVSTDRIILSTKKLSMPSFGGSKQVDLRSNIEYYVSVEGAGGWLTADLTPGKVDELTVSASVNTTGSSRTAKVVVRGVTQTDVYDEMTVTQSTDDPTSPFESDSLGLFGYNTKGENITYKKFSDQLSYSNEYFRIVYPGEDKFIEIFGIPTGDLKVGMDISFRLVQNKLQGIENNSYRKAKVYKISGNLIWLIDSKAVGYTIKR